jgi:hypothetical protein
MTTVATGRTASGGPATLPTADTAPSEARA